MRASLNRMVEPKMRRCRVGSGKLRKAIAYSGAGDGRRNAAVADALKLLTE
jgi:hypothetical protein